MTARDDAIEAGAKAMFESGMPKAVVPWEQRSADYQRAFLTETARIHDAMAGPMRADIGRQLEEMDLDDDQMGAGGWFSAALKARADRARHKVADEIADAIQAYSGKGHASYAHAAEIARKLGGAA